MSVEHCWRDSDRGNLNFSTKTCPSATLCTTNRMWTGKGSNVTLGGERPGTNALCHGTACGCCDPLLIDRGYRARSISLTQSVHPLQCVIYCTVHCFNVKVKVTFTLGQATKAQRANRGIASSTLSLT